MQLLTAMIYGLLIGKFLCCLPLSHRATPNVYQQLHSGKGTKELKFSRKPVAWGWEPGDTLSALGLGSDAQQEQAGSGCSETLILLHGAAAQLFTGNGKNGESENLERDLDLNQIV